ncbi:MAG: hypothetical protein EBZ48_06535 [Proteobacteria bacterium]|nr:hypothetical protein [Pseudomonadota bacterium]
MGLLDVVTNIGASFGIAGRGVGALLRFAAEPASRVGSSFASVKGYGGNGGSSEGILDNVAEEIRPLLEAQMALQLQMQQTNIITNIVKDEHDMRMSVIRNLKVE